jgi:hypothetical protein
MTTDFEPVQQPLLGPDVDELVDGASSSGGPIPRFVAADTDDDQPLGPINWNLLTADEAEAEWLDLNAWVHWLRATYG